MAVHGVAARAGLDWKTVKLQTFFRGNLLRYFTDERMSDAGANAAVKSGVADVMDFEVCSTMIFQYARSPSKPFVDTARSTWLTYMYSVANATYSMA